VTANPTAEWIARQITEAFPWGAAPRYLIRDRDTPYGAAVTQRLQAADLKKRILDGETADVIILTRAMMDDLQRQNKLSASGLSNVAGTPVSVVARAGAPKPDIGSVDAFKETLLAPRSIVYADPAKGGASGVYFANVLNRLGIAEQLKGKTILVPGAQAAEVVAKGDAGLGIAQASEIVPVAGAHLIGPLPGELASTTVFTAEISAESKSTEAAQALIRFLTGPEAVSRFKTKGFKTGIASLLPT
jgi:molybdate transport system substrate-binding protein